MNSIAKIVSPPAAGTCSFGLLHLLALVALVSLPGMASGQEQEKANEDPTKIATKLGIAYSDNLTLSGSLAIGPKAKFNARIHDGGEWSLGASYLFSVAILTFSAAKTEFDNGSVQTRYSLGGFVPLTGLGLKTGRWQLFTPFGYTYTEGEMSVSDLDLHQTFAVEVSSNSGYVGLFGLLPYNERISFLAGGIVTKGSDNFSGYSAGGGVSYHLTPDDTIALFASYVDNSFGQKQKLGLSYQHEF